MSRSRKRFAGYTDYGRKRTKYHKRCASKAVRRADNSYFDGVTTRNVKRFYPSWDIRDWVHIYYEYKTPEALLEYLKRRDKEWVLSTRWYRGSSDEQLWKDTMRYFGK